MIVIHKTYVRLERIERSRLAVNHAVLILNGVLHSTANHCVQLVAIVESPGASGHLGNQNNKQTAEEL